MPIPTDNNIIQRPSAREIVYEQLCEWIVTGVLKPGEKLSDVELASHFGVSRTPVREAIQLLHNQKFVCIIPSKATVVAELDEVDMEKCYRVIAELDALASEQACLHKTPEKTAELKGILDRYLTYVESGDAENTVRADNHFHEAVREMAGNEYLSEFAKTMVLHIRRIKYRYYQDTAIRAEAASQHRAVFEAIISGDAEAAKEAMRAHWLYAMEKSIGDVLARVRRQEAGS